MEACGKPPSHLMAMATRKDKFFDAEDNPILEENSRGKCYYPDARPLRTLIPTRDEKFVDLVEKCLNWDFCKRITPSEALRHPWILE